MIFELACLVASAVCVAIAVRTPPERCRSISVIGRDVPALPRAIAIPTTWRRRMERP